MPERIMSTTLVLSMISLSASLSGCASQEEAKKAAEINKATTDAQTQQVQDMATSFATGRRSANAPQGNVLSRAKEEVSPTEYMIMLGDLGKVKASLRKGASINARGLNGRTPLHLAAELGKLEIVRYLVLNGADQNAKNNAGKTPLQVAQDANQTAVIKFLKTGK